MIDPRRPVRSPSLGGASRPEDATAIVTAADSGIGKAVALARDGLDAGLTSHTDADGAADTAAQVGDLGRRAQVRQVDLTDLPDAADVVDDLADALGGRLWALVANAGGAQRRAPFLEQDYDGWRQDLALNLDGAFMTLQRAARRMLGAHGITVNAVAPGQIATPLTGRPTSRPGAARVRRAPACRWAGSAAPTRSPRWPRCCAATRPPPSPAPPPSWTAGCWRWPRWPRWPPPGCRTAPGAPERPR